MIHPPPELEDSLLFMLATAHRRAQDRVQAALAGTRLTFPQYLLLEAVAAAPGATQAQVTVATGIDRSTLVEIVKRLAGSGLLTQAVSPTDRRASALTLTELGLGELVVARERISRAETEVRRRLSAPKLSSTLIALRRLVQSE